jgi:hypothetical protein
MDMKVVPYEDIRRCPKCGCPVNVAKKTAECISLVCNWSGPIGEIFFISGWTSGQAREEKLRQLTKLRIKGQEAARIKCHVDRHEVFGLKWPFGDIGSKP